MIGSWKTGTKGAIPVTQYGLTCLSPLLRAREPEARQRLVELAAEETNALARLPMLHIARWYVLDRLPDLRGRMSDPLTASYLVFIAHIDGHRDDFLDEMFASCRDLVDSLYGCCAGFGGVRHPYQFRRFMHRSEIRPTLFYAGAPAEDVAAIRRALATRERLIDFILGEQAQPPEGRRERFMDFAGELPDAGRR